MVIGHLLCRYVLCQCAWARQPRCGSCARTTCTWWSLWSGGTASASPASPGSWRRDCTGCICTCTHAFQRLLQSMRHRLTPQYPSFQHRPPLPPWKVSSAAAQSSPCWATDSPRPGWPVVEGPLWEPGARTTHAPPKHRAQGKVPGGRRKWKSGRASLCPTCLAEWTGGFRLLSSTWLLVWTRLISVPLGLCRLKIQIAVQKSGTNVQIV